MQTQETNNNLPEQDDTQNYMSTLTAVVNKVVKSGYTESFKVTKQGLYSAAHAAHYQPADVNIINFYRFEGESDPADNTIMYVIETNDGLKGTLIDAYGPYSDETTNKFMHEVEEIQKVNKSDLTFNDSKETPDDSA